MATTRRARRILALGSALALGVALSAVPRAADAGSTTPVTATAGGASAVYYGLLSGDGTVTVLKQDDGDWVYDRTSGDAKRFDQTWNGGTVDGGLQDVSDDGRYVLFNSNARVVEEPVDDDCLEDVFTDGEPTQEPTQCLQLYVRDTELGTTSLVSVDVDGGPVPEGSEQGALSSDGRYLAMTTGTFQDTAPRHRHRTLVRDLVTGTTEEVSVRSDGTSAQSDSLRQVGVGVSDDGDQVLFGSMDGTLAGPGEDGFSYYVHDRSTGTTSRLFAASVGAPEGARLDDLTMSDDGDVVAFYASQALLPSDTGNDSSVYAYDRSSAHLSWAGPGSQESPRLSGDGRKVAYNQYGAAGADRPYDVHVLDIASGTAELAGVDSSGQPVDDYTVFPSLSDDGRFLGFSATGHELRADEPGDQPTEHETRHFYVRDLAPTPDTATGAGAASTGVDPSVTDPVETSVSGSPGTVTIEELAQDPSPLTGWNVLGQQVRITAAPVTTPGGFMTFTFAVDRSVLPPGSTPADVQVLRNGTALPDCADGTDVGPCVADRALLADGDLQVVAHSPQASVWALATAATEPTPKDTSGPTITLQTPSDGGTYTLGQQVTVRYACADDSGVATCAGPVASGRRVTTPSSIGSKTFTVNARDRVGNTSSATATYRIVWPLVGLQAPVDAPPVLNLARRGAIVPIVFSLGGNRGTSVFANGSPSSSAVGCSPGARTDTIERTLPSSASRLSYSNGKYTYAWRTDPAWKGTCRRFVVRFADGQERVALFRFS